MEVGCGAQAWWRGGGWGWGFGGMVGCSCMFPTDAKQRSEMAVKLEPSAVVVAAAQGERLGRRYERRGEGGEVERRQHRSGRRGERGENGGSEQMVWQVCLACGVDSDGAGKAAGRQIREKRRGRREG